MNEKQAVFLITVGVILLAVGYRLFFMENIYWLGTLFFIIGAGVIGAFGLMVGEIIWEVLS